MRVHLACDNDIFPPRFGGTQRLFGLARGLATRAEVRALCIVPNRSTGATDERAHGVAIHRCRAWYTSVAWWLERGRVAPLFTADLGHRAHAGAFRRALGPPADVLMCDLGLTALLHGAPDTLRVYHAQNVEALRWREAGPRVLARGHWARVMSDLERRAVAESDLTVVCTDEDAAQMRALHGAHDVEVIANGYDETVARPADEASRQRARRTLGLAPDAYVIAFVGGDWSANHEALAFLRREVLPHVVDDGVVLLAIGGVARGLVGVRERGLVAVGETPDLGAVLDAADVGLNPMAQGGGSNVKVPTYLAQGLAVISTPFGMRGYSPLAPGVTVVPREGFVEAVRRRPRGWAAQGQAAPAALADYAWGTLGARLAERFATRLAARGLGAA